MSWSQRKLGAAGWRLLLSRALSYAILTGGAALVLVPLVWTVISSVKPNNGIFVVPMEWIPREIHLENYVVPFRDRAFPLYFLNSLFAAVSSTLITLVISSLAGFSLAKYHYFGKNVIFLAILSTMMLPVQVILVPLYLVVRDLGWLDNYLGLIVPQAVTAFGIFLMRQHLLSIPDDFMDAARVDGCSEFRILWRIILPMSQPALSAVAIFAFLGSWDSYLWPLVVITQDRLRTLPLGLAMFFTQYSSNYAEALAVSVVIACPVLVVFVLMQRQFVEGLTRSGLRS
jgi:ABC-type glycerol-3-phosphate transport system permease component